MPLLSWNLAVCFQPAVHNGNELTQHRITRWLSIREIVRVPVSLLGVFLDSFKAVTCDARYFPQTFLFIFVEIFDILHLSHS